MFKIPLLPACRMLVVSATGVLLLSCQGMGAKRNAATSNLHLKLTPPTGKIDGPDREKWVAIDESDGQHFVQAKDGMDDVVSLYGYVSPTDSSLTDIDALEAKMRSDEDLKFEKLRRSEVLGVPVLRFERYQEDNGNGDERIRAALRTRGRTLAPPYHVRTIGALIMHPSEPHRFVTVACARASYHGEIGSYYEGLFEDFLANFIADNALGAQRFE